MKTKSDLAYYALRARQSHDAASCSRDVCARDAHHALAAAYDRAVSRLTASASKLSAPSSGAP